MRKACSLAAISGADKCLEAHVLVRVADPSKTTSGKPVRRWFERLLWRNPVATEDGYGILLESPVALPNRDRGKRKSENSGYGPCIPLNCK
jgi:hypothetical protein